MRSITTEGMDMKTDVSEGCTARRANLARRWWWLLPLICGLGACALPQPQADLTRYYLLGATGATGATGAGRACTVGLREVAVPAYLQPKSFAIRTGPNEIKYLDFTCWGEPLDLGITRVLAEDLRAHPRIARVIQGPFRPNARRNYDVAVRVTACEGTTAGAVRFAADWQIMAPGGGKTVAGGSFTAPTDLRWNGRDYGELAARLSEAVADLGRTIAAALPGDSSSG